jgi:hypothetical protein
MRLPARRRSGAGSNSLLERAGGNNDEARFNDVMARSVLMPHGAARPHRRDALNNGAA